MASDATKAHECTCERSWAGIEFDKAELKSDGQLGISHACERHEDGICIHLISARTTALIKAAVCGD